MTATILPHRCCQLRPPRSQAPARMMSCEKSFVRALGAPTAAHQGCNLLRQAKFAAKAVTLLGVLRAPALRAHKGAQPHQALAPAAPTGAMAASAPCALANAHGLAPRRCTPAAAHPARSVPCAPSVRRGGAARCARARRVVASATKGDSASGGSSKPGVDDWISRWKERKSSGSAAPPPRSAEESFTGPDPRTAYCYVFAGGLSKEACAFNALILRDALEPRGVLLHATQLLPPNGLPWTLRCVALSQCTRHARQLTRMRVPAAARCEPLRSRSRPWPATCRCASSVPPRARWCVRCTRSATRRLWTRSS